MSEFYVENMNLLARIGIMSTLWTYWHVLASCLLYELTGTYWHHVYSRRYSRKTFHWRVGLLSQRRWTEKKNGFALSTTCSKIIAQSTGVNFRKFNIYYLRNYFLWTTGTLFTIIYIYYIYIYRLGYRL